jgi:hypothetical protein
LVIRVLESSRTMNKPTLAAITRRRNSALWTGSLLVLLGMIGNTLSLFSMPAQRFLPWPSVVLPGIGLAFLLVGLRRAFKQREMYGGRVSGSILAAVSALLFGVSLLYFFHSRALPASSSAPRVGDQAPRFVLPNSSGQAVSLNQYLSTPIDSSSGKPPKAVLLIFYRGYW